jgi:hypothetical protein
LYSCQFYDFPFVNEILSSRSNTCMFLGTSGSWGSSSCCAVFALVVLVSRAHRCALFSRERKSRTSQLIQSFGKQQNHGAKIFAFFFLFFFVQKWSSFSLTSIPSSHRISQTLKQTQNFCFDLWDKLAAEFVRCILLLLLRRSGTTLLSVLLFSLDWYSHLLTESRIPKANLNFLFRSVCETKIWQRCSWAAFLSCQGERKYNPGLGLCLQQICLGFRVLGTQVSCTQYCNSKQFPYLTSSRFTVEIEALIRQVVGPLPKSMSFLYVFVLFPACFFAYTVNDGVRFSLLKFLWAEDGAKCSNSKP